MRPAIAFLIATLVLATPTLAGHLAIPHIHVSALNLGDGLIQYTVEEHNPLGGATAVEVSAVGNFNQIDANVPIFAGGTGMLDPVDSNSLADAAEFFDASYLAAGGKDADSWWDDTDLSTPGPPFGGAAGGVVGSTVFNYSGGSPAGSNILLTVLGQIVIFDAAMAGVLAGPLDVVESGLAQWSFVDVLGSNPPTPSIVAAGGMIFEVNGSFAVTPEPSTLTLTSLGLIGLLIYGWRRQRA